MMAAMLVTKSNQGKINIFFSVHQYLTKDIVYNSFGCKAQYHVLKRLSHGPLYNFANTLHVIFHQVPYADKLSTEDLLTTSNIFYLLLSDHFKKLATFISFLFYQIYPNVILLFYCAYDILL